MPKKKNKENTWSTKYKWIFAFVLIILFSLATPWAYLRYKIDRTSDDLNSIGQSLTISSDATYTTEKGCRRDVVKYGKGTLRCSAVMTLETTQKNRVDRLKNAFFEQGWEIINENASKSRHSNDTFIAGELKKNLRVNCGFYTSGTTTIIVRCSSPTSLPVYFDN